MIPRNDRGAGRPAVLAWSAVVVILLGVVGLVTYALTHVATPATAEQTARTSPGVLAALSTVPASTFDAVGVSVPGATLTPPQPVTGPALTSQGKPEVLFVGAEYCPFCAAERWPLIVALSRFGRFRVLHDATSAPQSVFPSTPTFSFVDNEYSSPYLTFTGVELYSDLIGADGSFTRIAQLTPAQSALIARSTGAATLPGTVPFVDLGGRMFTTTAAFSPALLAGQSQVQIAGDLADPPTASTAASTSGTSAPSTGRVVIAAANQLTAGICLATGQRPATVCQSKGVRAAALADGTT